MFNFEKLETWHEAIAFADLVYALTRGFPAEERFGLTAQIKRAAFSVPANIVEGYAFSRSATRLRHLRIAIGSLAELGYALHFARRANFISQDDLTCIDEKVRRTAAPLHGLLKQQGG